MDNAEARWTLHIEKFTQGGGWLTKAIRTRMEKCRVQCSNISISRANTLDLFFPLTFSIPWFEKKYRCITAATATTATTAVRDGTNKLPMHNEKRDFQ